MRVTRVVMAYHLNRAIEAHEDIHHCECRNVRCVEPSHLAVITAADHRAHHAQERRQTHCPRHGTPYDALNVNGANRCRKCEAEASARYRARHPHYQRPPLTEEQRLRRNERIRARRATPEGGAKMRAWDKAKTERRKALKAQYNQVA